MDKLLLLLFSTSFAFAGTKSSNSAFDCMRYLILSTLSQNSFNESRDREYEMNHFFTSYKNDPAFVQWLMENYDSFALEKDRSVEDKKEKLHSILNQWDVEHDKQLDQSKSGDLKSTTFEKDPKYWDFSNVDQLFKNKPKFWNVRPKNVKDDFGIGFIKEFLFSNIKSPFNRYDEQVLLLRKGDYVVYFDKVTNKTEKVKLGNFLGAGNTTHIYEIDGRPEAVIRIPFIADVLARSSYSSHRHFIVKKFFNRYLKRYEKIKAAKIPCVEILSYGEGSEIIITSRVHEHENGEQFYLRLVERGINLKNFKDPKFENDEEVKKLKILLHYSDTYKAEADKDFSPSESFASESHFRQFIWSEKPAGWTMVDWE